MSKIAFLSELDQHGSGYTGITEHLCNGLAEMGHEVKVIAFSYRGEEHFFPFSVLPVENANEAVATIHNLKYVWQPDIVVVALDIPFHERLLPKLKQYDFPYIGITPLESEPLCMTWAMTLMQMDKVFFISEFGAEEAQKAGVPAEHIQIGIDTEAWRMPAKEEKQMIRKALFGIEDDETFVVLTVADNQERKNLSAAMQIMSKFKEDITDNFRYVLVTRQFLPIGWKLSDLATKLNIFDKTIIFDKGRPEGISFKELWAIYAGADCFLLTSKGEGLGLPLLEAMSVGLPVIATDVGACTEHIQRGGGWLMWPAFKHIDPFGNANRYYVDVGSGVDQLVAVHAGLNVEQTIQEARAYVESRTWDIPAKQLDAAIQEVIKKYEQTKPQVAEQAA